VIAYQLYIKYKTVEEFLADIKKEFGEEDKKGVKVTELKRLEQESKTMKEFVQESKRAVRDSGYEERLLIEELKKGMNGTVC